MGENSVEDNEGEIQTEIKTAVEYDGEGFVYAVKTAQQGQRRVDFKIGHIDGTYAEGYEYYYDGEVFYTSEMTKVPENAPSGRYKDTEFYELMDADASVTDDTITETKEYDKEGVDTDNWAEDRLEGSLTASELLEEDWPRAAQDILEEDI
ncbi:hypothetical protein ACOJIV_20540 [Haloarcula sp. AONF1]